MPFIVSAQLPSLPPGTAFSSPALLTGPWELPGVAEPGASPGLNTQPIATFPGISGLAG